MHNPHIPERYLREIWHRQLFNANRLTTPDGQPVRILSPGTPNHDTGPDFLDARIRIGRTTYCGDVEVHTDAAEWHAHSHQDDPHYNRVILHVVLTADPLSPPTLTPSLRRIPLLVLHPYLDETLRSAWTAALMAEDQRQLLSIPCFQLNSSVSAAVISQWLEKLGHERIELKIRRFEERLKQLVDERRRVLREPYPRYYGDPAEIPAPKLQYTPADYAVRDLWDQLLYEGLMEALGYSKNAAPFLCLAQSMRLDFLKQFRLEDTSTMMALLFGAAGLLPSIRSARDARSRAYVHTLRRTWLRLRPQFKGPIMNTADWMFFRLRPGNFPTARLAALCFLLPKLFGPEGFRTLVTTIKDSSSDRRTRHRMLLQLFSFEPDEFWKTHYHFSTQTPRASITIGPSRVNDILVNVVLPVGLLYARIFRDTDMREQARRLLDTLPPLQDNSVTRTIEHQLCRRKAKLRSPLVQQGAVQLFKFYCTQGRCGDCEVGRKLNFPSETSG